MNHTRRKEKINTPVPPRRDSPDSSIIDNGGKGASGDDRHQRKHGLYYQGKRLSSASPVIRKAPSKERLIGGKVMGVRVNIRDTSEWYGGLR